MRSKSLMAAGVLAVAGGILIGAVPLVQASEAQMAAVKERQELMKAIGGNMKIIGDYLKGASGTADDAKAAAAKIGEQAEMIPAAFETEASLSEMDAVGKNRGKPEIWLDWEAFKEDAEVLKEKSMAVVAAFDGGDMSAVQAAVGAMGKEGCGGCHEDFRGPKVD